MLKSKSIVSLKLLIISLFFICCNNKTHTVENEFILPKKIQYSGTLIDNIIKIDSIKRNYVLKLDNNEIKSEKVLFDFKLGDKKTINDSVFNQLKEIICSSEILRVNKSFPPFLLNQKVYNDSTYRLAFSATRKEFYAFGIGVGMDKKANELIAQYKESLNKCEHGNLGYPDNLNESFSVLLDALLDKYGDYNLKIENMYYWFNNQTLINLGIYTNKISKNEVLNEFKNYPYLVNNFKEELSGKQEELFISYTNLILENEMYDFEKVKKELKEKRLKEKMDDMNKQNAIERETKIKEVEKNL